MERLTLKQAISHCIERSDCTECGKQHQQLAEWLEELKHYRELKAQDRLIELSESGIGNLSDGYHTFNELYHHRAILFSVICNNNPLCSWKSKKHHDGTMYDGMFIVGINTPDGQATYHYDIEPYWELFKVPEAEYAPEWDGHTPSDAIERISNCKSWQDLKENNAGRDYEHILISALRYALGRRTYVVELTVNYIIKQIPNISDRCKAIMIHDIEHPLGSYGDECDRADWMRLLAELRCSVSDMVEMEGAE